MPESTIAFVALQRVLLPPRLFPNTHTSHDVPPPPPDPVTLPSFPPDTRPLTAGSAPPSSRAYSPSGILTVSTGSPTACLPPLVAAPRIMGRTAPIRTWALTYRVWEVGAGMRMELCPPARDLPARLRRHSVHHCRELGAHATGHCSRATLARPDLRTTSSLSRIRRTRIHQHRSSASP